MVKKRLTFVSLFHLERVDLKAGDRMAETSFQNRARLCALGPAIGQRVRNTQPDGGLIGEGKSPSSN
jgi:hypothetical protein